MRDGNGQIRGYAESITKEPADQVFCADQHSKGSLTFSKQSPKLKESQTRKVIKYARRRTQIVCGLSHVGMQHRISFLYVVRTPEVPSREWRVCSRLMRTFLSCLHGRHQFPFPSISCSKVQSSIGHLVCFFLKPKLTSFWRERLVFLWEILLPFTSTSWYSSPFLFLAPWSSLFLAGRPGDTNVFQYFHFIL